MGSNKSDAHEALVLSVDVGGSKYLVGYVSEGGEVLCSERREWADRTPDGIVGQLVRACEDLRAAHPDLAARESVGGMTIPGFADPVRGVWVDSDFLDVHDLPICDLLSERLGIRFHGDNDCNACVLAEAYFGGARGVRDFLYMTVSSGIGGGTFLSGDLYYGAHCQSGEIGLTIVEPGGRPSLSGNQLGPLEMYGCTSGMSRTFVELGGPELVDGRVPGGREIADLARGGDSVARRTVELEGRYLGRQIADADALLGPERVVLGGGISLLFDLMEAPLLDELRRLRPDTCVVVSATEFGYEGALLGAAACGLRGLRGFSVACGIEPDDPSLQGADGHAPDDGGTVLAVAREVEGGGDPRVRVTLEAGGRRLLPTDSGHGGLLGDYLVSTGIDDPGTTLDGLFSIACGDGGVAALAARAREGDEAAAERLEGLGDALGRALAFCGMVLDPGEIRLGAGLREGRALMSGPMARAIQRDTYWEPGKVPYRIEWDS